MSVRWAQELPIDIDRGNWHSKNNKAGEPIPFDEVRRAWYQREVTLPSRWRGKRILLSADNVELSANVFVDGVLVGQIAWPHGEVDLTAQAAFDRPVILSFRLAGTAGDIRGLAGDVFLEARPQGAALEELYLVPSVSRETLTIRARVSGAAAQPGWTISGEAERDGRRVFSFEPQPISPSAEGEFSLVVPWKDAARWDFDSPVLHDVRIRLAADMTALHDVVLVKNQDYNEQRQLEEGI